MAAFEQLFKALNINEPELWEALLQTAVEQKLPVNSFVVEQRYFNAYILMHQS